MLSAETENVSSSSLSETGENGSLTIRAAHAAREPIGLRVHSCAEKHAAATSIQLWRQWDVGDHAESAKADG